MAGLLRKLALGFAQAPVKASSVVVDGVTLPVEFRSNARAKRMVLRLTRDQAGVTVTLPKRVSRAQAQAFVEKSVPWVAAQLKRQKPATAIRPGAAIPLRGVLHVIEPAQGLRGLITACPNTHIIQVPGDPAHLPRRLEDWLKKLAKSELSEASQRYAQAMQVEIGRITVRDQKSRWGSCSAKGDLSYSWRLILAPTFVLDYVAAHEVAHRRHMNHGPGFWRLVLTHCPHAGDAKKWFKAHSAELHRFSK